VCWTMGITRDASIFVHGFCQNLGWPPSVEIIQPEHLQDLIMLFLEPAQLQQLSCMRLNAWTLKMAMFKNGEIIQLNGPWLHMASIAIAM